MPTCLKCGEPCRPLPRRIREKTTTTTKQTQALKPATVHKKDAIPAALVPHVYQLFLCQTNLARGFERRA
jgi:hypothetical protein